jgi:hypothetical protein
MRNEIQLDDMKFWVDQNIMYCKMHSDLKKTYQKIDIEEIFYNGISILSNGKYMPIIIDLENLGFTDSIKLFKVLAHSQIVRSLILSQVFLVHSLRLKVILSIYNFNRKPFFLNKICNDLNGAIKYCNKDNMVFNSIRLNE